MRLLLTAFAGVVMKIELTLSSKYCQNWGVWEGLREFAQNGMDAQDEGFPFTVERKNGRVRFFSAGASITTDSLLLGESKKGTDARGRFGEGYKVGALALLRSGKRVTLRTGVERWKFGFQNSKAFGAKVLCVTTSQNKSVVDGVEIVVSDVSQEEWDAFQERILPPSGEEIFEVPYVGRLLLKSCFRGKLFVRGIFVQGLEEGYRFGYDLPLVLDRDRMIARDFDIQYSANRLLEAAIVAGVVEEDMGFSMLESEAPEFAPITEWTPFYECSRREVAGKIGASFIERYGQKAVPVSDMEMADNIRSIGYVPVIVPKALKVYLENSSVVPPARGLLEWALEKVYLYEELSANERSVLSWCLTSYKTAKESAEPVEVVDFHEGALKVLSNGGKILIARGLLSDASQLLLRLMRNIDSGIRDECWLRLVVPVGV